MDCNNHPWIWNTNKLRLLFEERTVADIQDIPINSERDDQLVWHLEKNEKFSTKSLYNKLIRTNQLTDRDQARFWKKLWGLNIQPRLKTFLWKCVHTILPLNGRIAQILPDVNKIFPNCGKQEETLTHIFMHCEFTISVLLYIGLDTLMVRNNHLEFHTWLVDWFHRKDMYEYQVHDWPEIMTTFLWGIWKSRCDWVFKNKKLSVTRTRQEIISMISSKRNMLNNKEGKDKIDIVKSSNNVTEVSLERGVSKQ
ncbi:uncharacterized protein LOC113316879 [Papaver somniferum]|uniref:uncharacterized protein LOC113316879 n=1 Tax=Papaver somniferum TaxID=3469 RepID=UPI000E6F664D|nr:uncharacterized protein LOC113316879 [Papaver somniferum]